MPTQFSFCGHETFSLRLNWLKKAVDIVHKKSDIFNSDSAIVQFGVGKNMVRSIRHWSLATEIIEKDPASTKHNIYRVSEFGNYLFGRQGVDPYCEDTATLWLLHWLLCCSTDHSTLWHFVFGHWRGGSLELRTLKPALQKWLEDRNSSLPSDTTLKRDFQCLIHTYVPKHRPKSYLENIVEFALVSLGLVFEDSGSIYLHQGHRQNLPPEIFAYTVLDYWNRNFQEVNTLSVKNVLMHRASPGQIFLLSEEHAFQLVTQIEAFEDPPFRFDSTAGIHQFYRMPHVQPKDMLERYYRHAHARLADTSE